MDGWKGRRDALNFIERHSVPLPNLIGSIRSVAGFFKEVTGVPLSGTPAFLVYDPKGRIATKQIGTVEIEVIEKFLGMRR